MCWIWRSGVVVLLFISSTVNAINPDSLKLQLEQAEPQKKSAVYERLLEYYFYNNLDTAIHYAYLLQANSDVYKQDSLQVKAGMTLGLLYHLKNDATKSQYWFNECDSLLSIGLGDRAKLTYHYYKGIHKLFISELDSALVFLDRSLKGARQIEDTKYIGRSLLNIGNVYWYNGHFTLALKYYKNSVPYLEIAADDRGRLYVLFNIANIYRLQDELEQGLKYYDEAYQLAQLIKDNSMLGNILNNKSQIYSYNNDNDSALVLTNQALDYFKKTGSLKSMVQATCNKAKYFLYLNQIDSTVYYLNKVETRCNIEQYTHEQINYYFVKAGLSKKRGKRYEQIKYLKKAESVAEKYQLNDLKLEVMHSLAEANADLLQYGAAYKYADRSLLLQDSIYNVNKTDAMAFLQKAFESVQQDKETNLLKTERKLLKLELMHEKQSSYILILLVVIVSLLAIGIFTVYLNDRRKKQELTKANLQLKESNRQLIEANDVKNKLFSILSHDLKSPISGIVSMSSLMEVSSSIKGETDLQMLHAINESSNMLMTFIDNTLFWFKKIHNKLKPDYQDVTIKAIMFDVEQWFTSFCRQKEIKLEFGGDDILIRTDINILQVILRNLIGNAIKFSHSKGLVQIVWQRDNRHLVVSIKDQGIGMSPQQMEQINLPGGIDQFTNGTNGETGTGLGLFLCKELLESIGGKMCVFSTEGKGTEVKFWLNISTNDD